MSSYFIIKIIEILISFYFTYKFKLQKKVISFLFRELIVYLPLNDDDFKQLMEYSKEKKENKNESKVLIRTCEFEEYCEKSQTSKYLDLDFLIFLYISNFIFTIFNIINRIIFILLIDDEGANKNDVNTGHINFSFNFYLTILFLTYIIYREIKKYIFFFSFISKAATEFYFCFIVNFFIFYTNEIYNEKLFNLNYIVFENIINNKIKSITSQIYFNTNHIKIFFSIIFGLNSGIFLRAIQRGAYFDNFFCNILNPENSPLLRPIKTNTSQKEEKNGIKLQYIVKIKSIINLFFSTLILEPLFDNYLEIVIINTFKKKLILIFVCLVIDVILGVYIIWYIYFIYTIQNYQKYLEFIKYPDQKLLYNHRNTISYINENAWDVCSHIFMIYFIPLYIFYSYIYEIDIFNKFSQNDAPINNNLYNSILFVSFISFQFSKGFIENGIFYYRLFTKEKNLFIF